jgi:hypothetical protein
MNETIDTVEEYNARKRPSLLTVLCVLTFVVSAYYVFSGIFGLFVAENFDQSQWDQISEQVGEALNDADENSAQIMETVMAAVSQTVTNAIENALLLGLTEIFVALLSAFGAYWMWSLRKSGFWIYTAAKVVGVAVPLILLGFNIVTIALYGFALFIGIIFIILYATTRKHMT